METQIGGEWFGLRWDIKIFEGFANSVGMALRIARVRKTVGY